MLYRSLEAEFVIRILLHQRKVLIEGVRQELPDGLSHVPSPLSVEMGVRRHVNLLLGGFQRKLVRGFLRELLGGFLRELLGGFLRKRDASGHRQGCNGSQGLL